MGKRLPTLTAIEVEPFSDRLDQLERFYADRRHQARDACRGRGVSPLVLSTVLAVLVRRTDKRTGEVSETLAQLAAASLELSTDQVRRALAVLRTLGWVETIAKPVSPGRTGGQGKPTVSRVTFLRPRVEPLLAPVDPHVEPVANTGMGARPDAHPFPVDNAGMGARQTGMGARLGAHPHGLEPRLRVSYSSQTFISSETTEAATKNPDHRNWVVGLVRMVKHRRETLTDQARAELFTYATAMESEYGQLPLDVHGSFLADYLIAKATSSRVDPALREYLDHASLREAVAV